MQTRPPRLDVNAAAEALGITPDGVRKRIKRGQLAGYHLDGRLYVVLDGQTDTPDHTNGHQTHGHDSRQTTQTDKTDASQTADRTLVARLEDEVRFLRSELERKDAIIMVLAQRPALPEPSLETKDENSTNLVNNVNEVSRPWWARWWPWGQQG